MKAEAIKRAVSDDVDLGEYVRRLIAADLSGSRPLRGRRRRKYDGIRRDLAQVHAAIIACSNRIEQAHGPSSDLDRQRQMTELLRDAVSALLLLARTIGAR